MYTEGFLNSSVPLTIQEASPEEAELLSGLISSAYRDVAETFGLTKQNCPKHPSNCEAGWVTADMDRGVRYYLFADAQQVVGCGALEHPDDKTVYLERLAVRPDCRHRGFGRQIVSHLTWASKKAGVKTMGIGIIEEQKILKDWYGSMGFVSTGTKAFLHLPFTVGFMELDIESVANFY